VLIKAAIFTCSGQVALRVVSVAHELAAFDLHEQRASENRSPSWDRRGGCASKKCCEASLESVDGVVCLECPPSGPLLRILRS